MTPVVKVKPGVQFARIKPAGFRILGAIERTARAMGRDLTITCGTEAHASTNPHTLGEAYDIRSRDLDPTEKLLVVDLLLRDLSGGSDDPPVHGAEGISTRDFFGFLEAPGTAHEHIHVQRRKGRAYPA